MPNIHKSRKQREQDDLMAARKLKPKLRKFLQDEQTKAAAATHIDNLKKAEDLLADIQATKRAAQLSMIALLDKKLWRLWPPAIEMSWTKWGVRDANDNAELHTDLAGFSSFLLRQYDTYRLHRDDKAGYPNPMDESDLAAGAPAVLALATGDEIATRPASTPRHGTVGSGRASRSTGRVGSRNGSVPMRWHCRRI